MSYKCFSNKVEIAIIGISNAGKSTFIGSLFEKDSCKLLRKIALENQGKGQTKIPVHYHLDTKKNNDEIVVEKVEWNKEIILEAISEQGNECSITSQICKKLGLSEESTEKIEDNDSLDGKLKEIESDYFKEAVIEDVFSKYINNKEFQEAGIIKCLYLVGKPSAELARFMKNFKFDDIIIRDTKGLLDEDFQTLLEKRTNLTEKGTDENEKNKILAERGLIGVNACILMNGTNATITDGVKELYANIFDVVANKMPTFLVERSAMLSQRLNALVELGAEVNEGSYFKALEDKKVTRYSFDNMERILTEYGIDNTSQIISEELVKRNYKKMLLADIADSMKKCDEDDEAYIEYETYIFTVNTIMKELLKSLSKLRQTIEEAAKVFSNNKRVLVNGFMQSYKKYFEQGISLYNNKRYDSRVVYDRYCKSIAEKILGYRNFYGRAGMLGKLGGLTYIHDEKLDSIAILKSGKYAIDAILNGLVKNEEISEPLIICISNLFTDNVQVRLAIGNLYILLNDYMLNGYSEYLTKLTIGRIINRVYLKNACEAIRSDEIGTKKYYTVFKKYTDDRNELSVVYGVLWKLLYGFIDTVDDNAIPDKVLDEMLLVK